MVFLGKQSNQISLDYSVLRNSLDVIYQPMYKIQEHLFFNQTSLNICTTNKFAIIYYCVPKRQKI